MGFVYSNRASASEVTVNSEQVTVVALSTEVSSVSTFASNLDGVLRVQLDSPLEFDCLVFIPSTSRQYCSSLRGSSRLIPDQIGVPFDPETPTDATSVNFGLRNDSIDFTNLQLFEIEF